MSSEARVTSVNEIDWRKILWLAESIKKDTNHAFILPNVKLSDTLVVELYGDNGERSRHVIALPSRIGLSEMKDSGNPPTISNVQLLEVKRGVFISATVGWETDTLADASGRYSNGDFLKTLEPRKRLGRKHQVVLSRLKPDRTYNFTAISCDPFGRSQVSDPLTFSTSEFFTAKQQPDSMEIRQEKGDEDGPACSFQMFGTDYLVELILKLPASVRIGTTREPRCLPDDEFHAGLSCRNPRAIETCLNCHSTHDHPLNVSPTKKGIIVPPEFPTLQDGRIICISCHEPHGSNYINLTRKDSEKGLCVSCHR